MATAAAAAVGTARIFERPNRGRLGCLVFAAHSQWQYAYAVVSHTHTCTRTKLSFAYVYDIRRTYMMIWGWIFFKNKLVHESRPFYATCWKINTEFIKFNFIVFFWSCKLWIIFGWRTKMSKTLLLRNAFFFVHLLNAPDFDSRTNCLFRNYEKLTLRFNESRNASVSEAYCVVIFEHICRFRYLYVSERMSNKNWKKRWNGRLFS